MVRHIVGFAIIVLIFSGCGVSNSAYIAKQYKRDKILSKEDTISDLASKESEKFFKKLKSLPDPFNFTGGFSDTTFISAWIKAAIHSKPYLSYKKYQTTSLVTKTGEKITYSTDFAAIAYNLGSYMKEDYYYKDFLFTQLIKSIGKQDYLNEALRYSPAMLKYAPMHSSDPALRAIYNAYKKITAIAQTLYMLSDTNPKIANLVYFITRGEFAKVDQILEAQKEKIEFEQIEKIEELEDKFSLQKTATITLFPIQMYKEACGKKIYQKLFENKSHILGRVPNKQEIVTRVEEVCKNLDGFDIYLAYEDLKEQKKLFGLAVISESIAKYMTDIEHICKFSLYENLLASKEFIAARDYKFIVDKYLRKKSKGNKYFLYKERVVELFDLGCKERDGKKVEKFPKETIKKMLRDISNNFTYISTLPHNVFYIEAEDEKGCVPKLAAAFVKGVNKRHKIYLLEEAKKYDVCKEIADKEIKRAGF